MAIKIKREHLQGLADIKVTTVHCDSRSCDEFAVYTGEEIFALPLINYSGSDYHFMSLTHYFEDFNTDDRRVYHSFYCSLDCYIASKQHSRRVAIDNANVVTAPGMAGMEHMFSEIMLHTVQQSPLSPIEINDLRGLYDITATDNDTLEIPTASKGARMLAFPLTVDVETVDRLALPNRMTGPSVPPLKYAGRSAVVNTTPNISNQLETLVSNIDDDMIVAGVKLNDIALTGKSTYINVTFSTKLIQKFDAQFVKESELYKKLLLRRIEDLKSEDLTIDRLTLNTPLHKASIAAEATIHLSEKVRLIEYPHTKRSMRGHRLYRADYPQQAVNIVSTTMPGPATITRTDPASGAAQSVLAGYAQVTFYADPDVDDDSVYKPGEKEKMIRDFVDGHTPGDMTMTESEARRMLFGEYVQQHANKYGR
ncbi:hypothetical protein SEA_JUMBO_4 [Gordonia phage Jumbo]|uniref:Uncharacterized protein n=1 Tax=Gordonia phage Jumbo TaxID=1887650 RepID=A0A1B3B0Q7_9CAUD|nr:hypothetical protein BIZ69_gp004 [Gordonia phage Jumbo]AOE44518.1 hypothetical protein SEA_JUMBO_4 [Gordonia phage Jumbo]